MQHILFLLALGGWLTFLEREAQGQRSATPPRTTLTERQPYEVVPQGVVRLHAGPLELVLVDNQAHTLPEAPHHRAGYNGIAVLKHRQEPRSLFVPEVAGLNFEHIHDGTRATLKEKFEPRVFPMEMRRIDATTYELYQPPTANFHLESCGRYALLPDGVIEYTFTCIPREAPEQQNFLGFFWASYIHQPENLSIWFLGRETGSAAAPRWVNGITPQHGVDATHPPANPAFVPKIESDFPLTLVHHRSRFEHTQSYYYAICRGMAWLQVFRPQDQIWFAQSPSGGGAGNPAWDFQWFIPHVQVDQPYGFVMRAAYVPFESREQIEQLARQIQQELRAR